MAPRCCRCRWVSELACVAGAGSSGATLTPKRAPVAMAGRGSLALLLLLAVRFSHCSGEYSICSIPCCDVTPSCSGALQVDCKCTDMDSVRNFYGIYRSGQHRANTKYNFKRQHTILRILKKIGNRLFHDGQLILDCTADDYNIRRIL